MWGIENPKPSPDGGTLASLQTCAVPGRTLLFTFRTRLRHWVLDRYAGTRLACLAKKRRLACWNTAPLLPVWA